MSTQSDSDERLLDYVEQQQELHQQQQQVIPTKPFEDIPLTIHRPLRCTQPRRLLESAAKAARSPFPDRVNTVVCEDFLAQFRHDLVCTDRPLAELANACADEKMILCSLIKQYMTHLEARLKNVHLTYLRLIDRSTYGYDDFGAYGKRLADFLGDHPIFMPRTTKSYKMLLKQYEEAHPAGVLTLRSKLLDALKRPAGAAAGGATAGNLVVDFSMVTYQPVDMSQLRRTLASLGTVPRQLEHFIETTSLPPTTRAAHQRILSSIKSALASSSPLASLRPKVYLIGSRSTPLAPFDTNMHLVIKFEAIPEPPRTKDLLILDAETSLMALEVIDRILLEKLNISPLAYKRVYTEEEHGTTPWPAIVYDFGAAFGHLEPGYFEFGSASQSSSSQNPVSSSSQTTANSAPPPPPPRFYTCTISVHSLYPVLMSKLLAQLTEHDRRFAELTMLLRHWMRWNDLLGVPHGFTTYGLTLLVLHFLQSTAPPVFPPLSSLVQTARGQINSRKDLGRVNIAGELAKLTKSKNCQPVAALAVEFFAYYRRYNFAGHVVSVRLGRPVVKREFANGLSPEAREQLVDGFLMIEDPLLPGVNVAAKWDRPLVNKWLRLVKAAEMSEQNAVCWLVGAATDSERLAADTPPNQASNSGSVHSDGSSGGGGTKRKKKVELVTLSSNGGDSKEEEEGVVKKRCDAEPRPVNQNQEESDDAESVLFLCEVPRKSKVGPKNDANNNASPKYKTRSRCKKAKV